MSGVKINGYAATPGTGPSAMRCKDCKHCVPSATTIGSKCKLVESEWTDFKDSNIKVFSKSCWRFEEG